MRQTGRILTATYNKLSFRGRWLQWPPRSRAQRHPISVEMYWLFNHGGYPPRCTAYDWQRRPAVCLRQRALIEICLAWGVWPQMFVLCYFKCWHRSNQEWLQCLTLPTAADAAASDDWRWTRKNLQWTAILEGNKLIPFLRLFYSEALKAWGCLKALPNPRRIRCWALYFGPEQLSFAHAWGNRYRRMPSKA